MGIIWKGIVEMWRDIRRHHLVKLKEALDRGEVDQGIIPLLDAINRFEEYVTRSSCYGRVSFTIEEGLIRKGKGKLIYRFHRPISKEEVSNIASGVKSGVLWVNIEGTIIHVACRDLESANRLLEVALKSGYKESSIYSLSNRGVTVEILLDRKYSIPIYSSEIGFLVSDDDLTSLINYVEERFHRIERAKKNLISLLNQL